MCLKVSAFVLRVWKTHDLPNRDGPLMALQRLRSDSSTSLKTNECSCRNGLHFYPTVANVKMTRSSAIEHSGQSSRRRNELIQRNFLGFQSIISSILFTLNFTALLSGGPQRGGAALLQGGVSVEGAPVRLGAGAGGGDDHQVRPLSRPEWKLEGSVRPCRTPYFSEQVPLPPKLIICFSNWKF